MAQDKMISVEVAYALPDRQAIIALKIAEGSTAYEAVVASGICQQFEQIDLQNDKMGIFGKAIKDAKTEPLKTGDRVEIYRPLIIDPKASRVKRAEKAKRTKDAEPDAVAADDEGRD